MQTPEIEYAWAAKYLQKILFTLLRVDEGLGGGEWGN